MPDTVFTPDQLRADGQNRVARTGQQVGLASGVVTIAEWVAQQVGWDGQLPTAVAAAVVGLLTAAGSWLMNRRRLSGQL